MPCLILHGCVLHMRYCVILVHSLLSANVWFMKFGRVLESRFFAEKIRRPWSTSQGSSSPLIFEPARVKTQFTVKVDCYAELTVSSPADQREWTCTVLGWNLSVKYPLHWKLPAGRRWRFFGCFCVFFSSENFCTLGFRLTRQPLPT